MGSVFVNGVEQERAGQGPAPTEVEAAFGPWLGVPEERQHICAVVDCAGAGRRQTCLYDGRHHHHGCIHYNCPAADVTEHGLRFRPRSWGLLCDEHFAVLRTAQESWQAARLAGKGG